MNRKADLSKIAKASDKIKAAAEEIVKSPLWFIQQILIRHETAVLEVMHEQQTQIRRLEAELDAMKRHDYCGKNRAETHALACDGIEDNAIKQMDADPLNRGFWNGVAAGAGECAEVIRNSVSAQGNTRRNQE